MLAADSTTSCVHRESSACQNHGMGKWVNCAFHLLLPSSILEYSPDCREHFLRLEFLTSHKQDRSSIGDR